MGAYAVISADETEEVGPEPIVDRGIINSLLEEQTNLTISGDILPEADDAKDKEEGDADAAVKNSIKDAFDPAAPKEDKTPVKPDKPKEPEPEPPVSNPNLPAKHITGQLQFGDLDVAYNEEWYIKKEQSFAEAMSNKLSGVRFKKRNGNFLTALQLVFEGGEESRLL